MLPCCATQLEELERFVNTCFGQGMVMVCRLWRLEAAAIAEHGRDTTFACSRIAAHLPKVWMQDRCPSLAYRGRGLGFLASLSGHDFCVPRLSPVLQVDDKGRKVKKGQLSDDDMWQLRALAQPNVCLNLALAPDSANVHGQVLVPN